MNIEIYLAFMFGFLSTLLINKINKDIESIALIDLFKQDFSLSWTNIDAARYLPNSDIYAAGTFQYRGVHGISISGLDTYLLLPIHNVELYQSEGPKLARYLGRSGRDKFWRVYLLSKDIESIRLILLAKELGENDNQYRQIIRGLIEALFEELKGFDRDLNSAYPFFARIIRRFRS